MEPDRAALGARVDAVLQAAASDGTVPGVVAVVGNRAGTQYMGAAGFRDREASVAMGPDAIFRVASLTKAVVSVAAMQLVEAGTLDLDAPVAAYRPEFDDLVVLEGFDGDVPRVRPPARRATVRNLLTQTSGLVYDAFDERFLRYFEITGVPMAGTGLASCFATPLADDPGSRFLYGMSTDWTGLVLEAVTGTSLDEHLRRAVLGPLGMADTSFLVEHDKKGRVAPVYVRQPDGSFDRSGFEWNQEPEFFSAGHGLYSSAPDYLKFQRLLLGGGEVDGVRLLAPGTVAAMSQNQIGDLETGTLRSVRPALSEDLVLGDTKWGFDLLIWPEGVPGGRAPGSFGWCGTFNSFYWVDRANDVTVAVHTQYLPLWDAGVLRLCRQVEQAVYERA